MTAENPLPLHQPLLLAGPTGSGKSNVALALAEIIGAEVVSFDSMQVYHGLDIGTAKLSVDERRGIPHHLIDVVKLGEAFDAAQFLRLARGVCEDISRRGRPSVCCGGTGLYFKVFLEGLDSEGKADAQLRLRLEALSLPELAAELAALDPTALRLVDMRNKRRIIRAIERIRVSGRPLAELRKPIDSSLQTQRFFVLRRVSADLRQRIDSRVDVMFGRGLVDETRRLLEHGLASNRTALQALGYRQVVEHLQGLRSLAETVSLVKARTWHYARRQMSWFRTQLRSTWLDVPPDETPSESARRLLNLLKPG